MGTPFTPAEMVAQQLGATAHGELVAADSARAAASGLEHETSGERPLVPLHPSLISGCRAAFVADEKVAGSSSNIGANGDSMGGVAMVAATVSSAAKRVAMGIRTNAQNYQGVLHEMAITGGIARLFGGAAEWSLYIVAQVSVGAAFTPVLWNNDLRVYFDGSVPSFVVCIQTDVDWESVEVPLPDGIDFLAGGASSTLIEIECRSGVVGLRIGVADGFEEPLIASQPIDGVPIGSTTTIRVGSNGAGAFANMHLGTVAAFGRVLSAVELFQLRAWAVQEFGAALA